MEFTMLLEVIQMTGEKDMGETGNSFSSRLETKRKSTRRQMSAWSTHCSYRVAGGEWDADVPFFSRLPGGPFSILGSGRSTIRTDQRFLPSRPFRVHPQCVLILAVSNGAHSALTCFSPFTPWRNISLAVFGFMFLAVSRGYAAEIILLMLP